MLKPNTAESRCTILRAPNSTLQQSARSASSLPLCSTSPRSRHFRTRLNLRVLRLRNLPSHNSHSSPMLSLAARRTRLPSVLKQNSGQPPPLRSVTDLLQATALAATDSPNSRAPRPPSAPQPYRRAVVISNRRRLLCRVETPSSRRRQPEPPNTASHVGSDLRRRQDLTSPFYRFDFYILYK